MDRKTLLVGQGSLPSCKVKNQRFCDNTMQAEGLSDFFKSQGKKGLNVS